MRSRTVRALATSAAVALLAGGAAVATTSTAFAAPTGQSTVTTARHAPMKRCTTVRGHYRTVTVRGRTRRVWVKPRVVCTR